MLRLVIIAVISLFFLLPKGPRVLGIDKYGVPSYQNNDKSSANYYNGFYTGIKYQCVEYARRWLIQVKGYTFPEVDHAYQIYDLPIAQTIKGKALLFESIPSSSIDIRAGDLVIYRKSDTFPHGHVAVVSDVDASFVYLSEQNMNKRKWKQNYSRKILKTNINDGTILGWKRIK